MWKIRWADSIIIYVNRIKCAVLIRRTWGGLTVLAFMMGHLRKRYEFLENKVWSVVNTDYAEEL
jgi:hypothetical protein